ncbi:DUF885 domain-containing protein [Altericista sp. CCNU0014]|uniref:DUF885 domain-containing protein n=1 Tax=Altericista sp. CCNU0014 TaxID=3082949 RepID=UPI00384CF253
MSKAKISLVLSSSVIRYIKFGAIALLTCCLCIAIAPVVPSVTAKSPDWVVRSDRFADLLKKAIAAEGCQTKLGVSKSLQEIDPAFRACRQQSVLQAVQSLEQSLAREKNDELRLDLEILRDVGQRSLRSYALDEKYRVPYVNLSKAILESFKSTLKETKSSSSQAAILAKLNQYAGLEPGKIALASSLERDIQAQLQKPEVALPNKDRLETDLKNNASQIDEIQTFLEKQNIPRYKEAYAQLKTQLFNYEVFVRREIASRAEKNFRLPAELYTLELEEQGIETPIEEVVRQAHAAFAGVQQQMEELAPQVAQAKGLNALHYRDVIRALKQEQLSAKDTLRLYQTRAKDLETIIENEHLVTLPKHKFKIRLATAQENESFPVPLYNASASTFVIPVLHDREKAKLYNDFTNPAMSWTLTVHEGRPGHDLQFAALKDQKLSRARTDFAKNATNIEGWATYAEGVMQPYMPLEGKFMSLQFQLLRAARAFLEPELQSGKITTADALNVLTQDAGFSKFFAEQEVKRYTARFPGQAPAYFYGSQQLLQLRSQTEKRLGDQFNVRKFNDFILSQGFLKPKLLKQILSSNM